MNPFCVDAVLAECYPVDFFGRVTATSPISGEHKRSAARSAANSREFCFCLLDQDSRIVSGFLFIIVHVLFLILFVFCYHRRIFFCLSSFAFEVSPLIYSATV